MRVAILTLPLTWNYGGILQLYSTKMILERNGHEVYYADKRKDRSNPLIHLFVRLKWFFIDVVGRTGLLKFAPLFAVAKFKQRHLTNKLPMTFSVTSLKEQLDTFDCVLVGSDQVWNKWAVSDVSTYFLHFLEDKVKRISISASFAKKNMDYTKKEIDVCRSALKKFTLVSTREQSGLDKLFNILDSEGHFFPDPVLLAGRSVFEDLIYSKPKGSLFVYTLDRSSEILNLVERVKVKYSNIEWFPNVEKLITEILKHSDFSVINYLKCIQESNFVITDSYHGTLFAILFNKRFICINNTKRGSDRFTSILSQLDLMEYLFDYQDLQYINANELPVPDWNKVNSLLESWRQDSIDKLYDSLVE